jgi:hypothetical protein
MKNVLRFTLERDDELPDPPRPRREIN